jgi:hypothetical protein
MMDFGHASVAVEFMTALLRGMASSLKLSFAALGAAVEQA